MKKRTQLNPKFDPTLRGRRETPNFDILVANALIEADEDMAHCVCPHCGCTTDIAHLPCPNCE